MFKLFALFALLALACAQSKDESKSFLVSQGLSPEAASGILAIADKHRVEDKPGNEEAAKKAMKESEEETANFMKTQSAADQAAYRAMIDKETAAAHH